MKKFEYRLSSVLRLYEIKLEAEKGKLSQLLAEERRILDCIEKRAEEIRVQNAAIRELFELHSGELRALSSYNLSAQAQNVILHQSLASIRQAIRAQRECVLREERYVKLLMKLKERKLSAWERAVEQQLEVEAQEVWLAVHRNVPSNE